MVPLCQLSCSGEIAGRRGASGGRGRDLNGSFVPALSLRRDCWQKGGFSDAFHNGVHPLFTMEYPPFHVDHPFLTMECPSGRLVEGRGRTEWFPCASSPAPARLQAEGGLQGGGRDLNGSLVPALSLRRECWQKGGFS